MRHEQDLTEQLLQGLRRIEGVTLYGPKSCGTDGRGFFQSKRPGTGEVCFALDQVFDIAARGGLHCALWRTAPWEP